MTMEVPLNLLPVQSLDKAVDCSYHSHVILSWQDSKPLNMLQGSAFV